MHKYIEATYKLYTEADNGLQLVEETQEGQPLRLYTGMGMTMDAYEKGIETFSEGEDYEFVVAKENAYGDYHDEMVIDIPRAELFSNGELDSSQVFVGAALPLQSEDGHGSLPVWKRLTTLMYVWTSIIHWQARTLLSVDT